MPVLGRGIRLHNAEQESCPLLLLSAEKSRSLDEDHSQKLDDAERWDHS
jgi:hypothetical protein